MEIVPNQPHEVRRLASYFNHVLDHGERSMHMDLDTYERGEDFHIDGIIGEVVNASGKSAYAISKMLGRNSNYVTQLKANKSRPGIGTLEGICDVVGGELYILIDGKMHRITR